MKHFSKVQQAKTHFEEGNYREALYLYQDLKASINSNAFDFNIKKCIHKLSDTQQWLPDNYNLNEYFDNIYLVNLKSQFAKKIKSVLQMRTLNIDFELFEAVNGYEGAPFEFFNNYSQRPLGQLKRYSDWNQREIDRKRHFIESPGAVGYIYTYLEILKDAKTNKYRRFLIIEDDVIFSNDFFRHFSSFICTVPDQWKILLLGASQYGWQSVDTNKALLDGFYYPRQVDTCGSFAIAIDHTVVEEIIEAQLSFEAPFDLLAMGEIYERHLGKCFVAYPNIVMPDVGDSSIRSKRCQFTHAKKMKWAVNNFKYPAPTPSIAILISSRLNLKYLDRFNSPTSQPSNLRFYHQSEDGLRPVHNVESIKLDTKTEIKAEKAVCIPLADFCVTLPPDEILSESAINRFLEYKLKLRETNDTRLIEIAHNQLAFVKNRVSVIIPTFKRPKNLNAAVLSVCSQDYADLEIIVVNDTGRDPNSTTNEDIRNIIDALKMEFPARNLYLIEHCINRNGAAARNTGIFHSTGEYLCFMDDDDIYLPGRISESVKVIQNTTATTGGVYCGFLGWNSDKNDESRYRPGKLSQELLLLDYKKHYLHTNTATYKREAVLYINGFDESYRRHQDVEFNLRFFEHYEMEVVKQVLVRLNPQPSEINNKIYGLDMLKLKSKFLTEFDRIISRFDQKTQDLIYNNHWEEVIRYSDPDIIQSVTQQISNSKSHYFKKH